LVQIAKALMKKYMKLTVHVEKAKMMKDGNNNILLIHDMIKLYHGFFI